MDNKYAYARATLGDIVKEQTNDGKEMGAMSYSKGEVIDWLRDRRRRAEAELIAVELSRFRLTVDDGGIVWMLTGPEFDQKGKLIELARG